MIIVCQQCGQKLPKTAVMCPNCGNRQFAQPSDNPTQPQQANSFVQSSGYHAYDSTHNAPQTSQLTQPEHSTWQSYTPNPSAGNYQPTDMPAVQASQPMQHPAQPIYAQPNPNYEQPNYAQPDIAQASNPPAQPTDYANPYVAPAVSQLPSTALQTRKPAYTMLYAGFVRRALAYLFDLALVSLLLGLAYQLLLPQILPQLGIRGFSDQTLALIAYGFYLFYMTLLTCLGRQATVGKVIMGMWVFGMQGQRLNFFHALIRETLKLILLPFGFLMWFTARKQTLHDLIARTVVLYDPN
ncbi:RDD family protein [Moraxella osloensis]|uniref:RDD family protein n=1 Tax=Faucicola osloensis TaxID=34062 RepID=UPI00200372C9|nr:RDD family protein [Moraxella osloensis]MCK6158593.1 RDD family protein [Moraxella osloensis]